MECKLIYCNQNELRPVLYVVELNYETILKVEENLQNPKQ